MRAIYSGTFAHPSGFQSVRARHAGEIVQLSTIFGHRMGGIEYLFTGHTR
jgi:hypothetical protein